MLQKLLLLAQKESAEYDSTELTSVPIAKLEIKLTPEDYEQLAEVERRWWEFAESGGETYPKVGGVVVRDPKRRMYLVFVGRYQITVVVNERKVLRPEPSGAVEYEPHTLAKVTITDYSLHPDRLTEYYVNPETWSMTQYVTGCGLAFLQQAYKLSNTDQPRQGPPETPENPDTVRHITRL